MKVGTNMKTITIIDDDIYIGNMLEEVLVKEGYKVLRAYSGTEALMLLEHNTTDLVLLDLMLPGLSGEEILPRIKDIPVIVISAKVDVEDKVNQLLGGAVDYLTKPFAISELLARIIVHLRIVRGEEVQNLLKFDDIFLNPLTHQVHIGENHVKLTKTEYAILKLLMKNPSQTITKSAILDKISEDTPDCMESSLKVHVSNLRRKLREESGKDYIEAVWGIGFKLRKE